MAIARERGWSFSIPAWEAPGACRKWHLAAYEKNFVVDMPRMKDEMRYDQFRPLRPW